MGAKKFRPHSNLRSPNPHACGESMISFFDQAQTENSANPCTKSA